MRFCLILLLASFCCPFVRPQSAPASSSPSHAQTDSVSSGGAAAPEQNGESWTELSLKKSGLPASVFNAVVLGKYEEPTYTRELVRVEWRRGDPIEVTVVRPRSVTKPPIILYLYDYTADTDRFQNDGWCQRATKDGFAAVGFVSALSGQRFHSPRPMRQWFVSELQESLTTSTHDVQLVLNYLTDRGDFDVSRTGMIAQGSGGAIAVLAASVDSRISALDLLNPWGDWSDWVKNSLQIPSQERAAYLAPEFLGRVAGLDPVDYLPTLKLKALRIQQVMDDAVTPPAARDKIAASARSPTFHVVRYANGPAYQEAWRGTGLSGWMREQLKPATVQP